MPGAAGQSGAVGLRARRLPARRKACWVRSAKSPSSTGSRSTGPAEQASLVQQAGNIVRMQPVEVERGRWPSASEFGEAGEHRRVQRLRGQLAAEPAGVIRSDRVVAGTGRAHAIWFVHGRAAWAVAGPPVRRGDAGAGPPGRRATRRRHTSLATLASKPLPYLAMSTSRSLLGSGLQDHLKRADNQFFIRSLESDSVGGRQ
jgi:hypothetical protein